MRAIQAQAIVVDEGYDDDSRWCELARYRVTFFPEGGSVVEVWRAECQTQANPRGSWLLPTGDEPEGAINAALAAARLACRPGPVPAPTA